METVKCPGCNSSLIYDLEDEILKCKHCGTVCTVQESKITDKQFLEDRLMDVHEAHCPTCGARLITDINTISTKCVYCGGSIIYDEKVNKVFKPKKILLFELGINEAKDKLNQFLKEKKVKNRENIVKELKTVYLPFWLYNSKVSLEYEEDYKKYVLKSEYKNILADASTHISNFLADKFDDNFDFTKLKDFELSLISGYFAEEFDVTAKQIYRRVLRKMEDKARQEFSKNITITNTVDDKMYILLPFYYVEFYEKSILNGYQILINGQNGNINIGETKNSKIDIKIDIPFNFYIRQLFAITSIIWMLIPLALIIALISGMLFTKWQADLEYLYILAISLIIFIPNVIIFNCNKDFLVLSEKNKEYLLWKYKKDKKI